jgi:hypothetical protein
MNRPSLTNLKGYVKGFKVQLGGYPILEKSQNPPTCYPSPIENGFQQRAASLQPALANLACRIIALVLT